MKIDENTPFKSLLNTKELKPFSHDLMVDASGYWRRHLNKLTFRDLSQQQPTWIQKDIIAGLENLVGKQRFNVYSKKDGLNHHKKDVSLIYLPAKNRKSDQPVILLSGGAYSVCCTMVESLPVGTKLNELGYDCFCLNYRTISLEDYVLGLFPKPLDDIAAAYQFIKEHNDLFHVDIEHYYLSGYSAGGHLAALFSTEEICGNRYGLPLPQGLLLGYPAVGVQDKGKTMAEKWMLTGMYGIHMKNFQKYNLHNYLNENYPATYIVHCKDDNMIDYHDIFPFVEYLKNNTGKVQLELGQWGKHGFGAGSQTSVEGWIERAMIYLQSAMKGE